MNFKQFNALENKICIDGVYYSFKYTIQNLVFIDEYSLIYTSNDVFFRYQSIDESYFEYHKMVDRGGYGLFCFSNRQLAWTLPQTILAGLWVRTDQWFIDTYKDNPTVCASTYHHEIHLALKDGRLVRQLEIR